MVLAVALRCQIIGKYTCENFRLNIFCDQIENIELPHMHGTVGYKIVKVTFINDFY
jgi:hypothetical protein